MRTFSFVILPSLIALGQAALPKANEYTTGDWYVEPPRSPVRLLQHPFTNHLSPTALARSTTATIRTC